MRAVPRTEARAGRRSKHRDRLFRGRERERTVISIGHVCALAKAIFHLPSLFLLLSLAVCGSEANPTGDISSSPNPGIAPHTTDRGNITPGTPKVASEGPSLLLLRKWDISRHYHVSPLSSSLLHTVSQSGAYLAAICMEFK